MGNRQFDTPLKKVLFDTTGFLGSQNLTRKQQDSRQIFCGNKSKRQFFYGILSIDQQYNEKHAKKYRYGVMSLCQLNSCQIAGLWLTLDISGGGAQSKREIYIF